jgi:hypothetical protein
MKTIRFLIAPVLVLAAVPGCVSDREFRKQQTELFEKKVEMEYRASHHGKLWPKGMEPVFLRRPDRSDPYITTPDGRIMLKSERREELKRDIELELERARQAGETRTPANR